MKVEYISHACLLIDTGDVRIATDPWFAGPAYSEQWYVFPKPVNAQAVATADVITISHGHEDHFHEDTLRGLKNKDAKIFYPHSWLGGEKEFIESLGFANVTEAVNWKKYRLTEKTSVTYIANGKDNIIVVENGSEVLVNVNDALHSEPDATIDLYVQEIRQKWPRIDQLFCGFGGASYFPNMLHLDGKDDRAVGAVREQLFAHAFCRVVAGLKPRVAVPFAADFALLEPSERWINEVRFPRSRISEYFGRHFAKGQQNAEILPMYPGDILDSETLKPLSPYRANLRDGELTHLIDDQYADEIREKKDSKMLRPEDADDLADKLHKHIELRAASMGSGVTERLLFSVVVTDVNENNAFNITVENGSAKLERAAEPASAVAVVISAPSRVLHYAMEQEWGCDSIGIGYGASFRLRDRQAASADLDLLCYQLLTHPHATFKSHLKENTLGVLSYLIKQPPGWTWKSWRRSASRLGNVNYDRSVWLLKSADELRTLFGLPEMGDN